MSLVILVPVRWAFSQTGCGGCTFGPRLAPLMNWSCAWTLYLMLQDFMPKANKGKVSFAQQLPYRSE